MALSDRITDALCSSLGDTDMIQTISYTRGMQLWARIIEKRPYRFTGIENYRIDPFPKKDQSGEVRTKASATERNNMQVTCCTY